MIRVLSAYRFVRILEGGTTKPWLVEVETEEGNLIQAVVKVFNPDQLVQKSYTGHEYLGAWLAQEFNLSTPEFFLVRLSNSFIKDLPFAANLKLDENGEAILFGNKYLEDSAIYSHTLLLRHLNKDDIAAIIAFDMLISNTDRRRGKPNLLLSKKRFFLIDHELAFISDPPSLNNLPHLVKDHVLFDHARKLYRQNGKSIFDFFCFSLTDVSSPALKSTVNRLQNLELLTARDRNWIDFVLHHKANSEELINLLSNHLK